MLDKTQRKRTEHHDSNGMLPAQNPSSAHIWSLLFAHMCMSRVFQVVLYCCMDRGIHK